MQKKCKLMHVRWRLPGDRVTMFDGKKNIAWRGIRSYDSHEIFNLHLFILGLEISGM